MRLEEIVVGRRPGARYLCSTARYHYTLVMNFQKYSDFFFFFFNFNFAPTDFDNLLADRPAPPGGAGGAGGGPPCISKKTTFKVFLKKGNYYLLHGLNFMANVRSPLEPPVASVGG